MFFLKIKAVNISQALHFTSVSAKNKSKQERKPLLCFRLWHSFCFWKAQENFCFLWSKCIFYTSLKSVNFDVIKSEPENIFFLLKINKHNLFSETIEISCKNCVHFGKLKSMKKLQRRIAKFFQSKNIFERNFSSFYLTCFNGRTHATQSQTSPKNGSRIQNYTVKFRWFEEL